MAARNKMDLYQLPWTRKLKLLHRIISSTARDSVKIHLVAASNALATLELISDMAKGVTRDWNNALTRALNPDHGVFNVISMDGEGIEKRLRLSAAAGSSRVVPNGDEDDQSVASMPLDMPESVPLGRSHRF